MAFYEGHFFCLNFMLYIENKQMNKTHKGDTVNMKKYLQGFMTLLLCAYSISAYSAFSVTQTSFGVDLDKPVTKDTTLINRSDKPVRVRVTFAKPKWSEDEYYLGDQLVAYPRMVMIPANGEIQVKIAARIKKELADGEYVAMLVFKEMPPRNSTDQVTMLMNIGVPYYGRKGELKTAMDLKNLEMVNTEKGYQLQGTGHNNGNFSYPLHIAVKFYQNNKLLKEQSFKQGFYRGHTVELKKSIVMAEDADYVEVVFANENINFSKQFRFEL